MAAYLRNQVFYALKSVLTPFSLLSSSSNDQVPGRAFDSSNFSDSGSSGLCSSSLGSSDSGSMHIEPSLGLVPGLSVPVSAVPVSSSAASSSIDEPNLRKSPVLNSSTNPNSQAMANRDGRRAPVLHAGESAQRRLF